MRGPISESGHRPNLISPGQLLLVDGDGWFISPNLEVALEALTCRPLCNSPFASVSRKTCLTFYIYRILLEFQIQKSGPLLSSEVNMMGADSRNAQEYRLTPHHLGSKTRYSVSRMDSL